MKREDVINVAVFCTLVVLGVATRWMSDAFKPALSNFTALGASALFAGYFFRNRLAAILLPLAVIAISNFCLLPFNNVGQFVAVYVGLLLAAAIGMLVRSNFNAWTVLGGSLASSVLFYLVTNFADWVGYDLYPNNAAGIVQSYIAALPFFGRTLAGDLFFTAAIFGTYWLIQASGLVIQRPDMQEAAMR